MVYRLVGGTPIEAMCLNPASSFYRCWQKESASCEAWADGSAGAIDDPATPPGVYSKDGPQT